MVRPYLNKEDHDEYLKQVKQKRRVERRKTAFYVFLVLIGMSSVGYYVWLNRAKPVSEDYPTYLGGETATVERAIETEESVAQNGVLKAVLEENPATEEKNIVLVSAKKPENEGEETESSKVAKQVTESVLPTEETVIALKETPVGNVRGALKKEEDSEEAAEPTVAEVIDATPEVVEAPVKKQAIEAPKRKMQSNPELLQEEETTGILFSAEQMPQYPGGYEALQAFLKAKTKVPQEAKDQQIEGKVQVQFVVTKEGKIKNARIAKGLGYGCDKEALAVLKKMPKWIPGRQNGKIVSVYYNLPVYFSGK